MKKISFILIFSFLVFVSKGQNVLTTTVAGLRANTSTAFTSAMTTDYGTGVFVKGSSTSGPDNTGLKIIDAAGQHWYRIYSGDVYAKWFGVNSDGTNEITNLQLAYNSTPRFSNLRIQGKIYIGSPLMIGLGKGVVGDGPQLSHLIKHTSSTAPNLVVLIASGASSMSQDSTAYLAQLTLDGNRSNLVGITARDTGLFVRNTNESGDMRINVFNVNIINTSGAGAFLIGRLGGTKFNTMEFIYNKVGLVNWASDCIITGVSVGRPDSIGIANRNANNRYTTISVWGSSSFSYQCGWFSTGKRAIVQGLQIQEIKTIGLLLQDESSTYDNVLVDRMLDSIGGVAVRFDCRQNTFKGRVTDFIAESRRQVSRTRYAIDVVKAVHSQIELNVDEQGSRAVFLNGFLSLRDSTTEAVVRHTKLGKTVFPEPALPFIKSKEVGAAAYTLQAGDNGFILYCDRATPIVMTVPTGLPEGFNVTIVQRGVGKVTVSGATLRNARGHFSTAQQNSVCFLIAEQLADTYIFGGDTGN